jgi:hypothetical protein
MSFIDDLRDVQAQVRKDVPPLVIEVPGTGGKFAVRFRALTDRDKLTRIVAVYRIGGALSRDDELQLLVDCCDEIVKPGEITGTWAPVAEEGESPLRFDASDERWGDGVKTARDCVRRLYNLTEYPLAAAGTADALIDWMQGTEAEVMVRVEAAGKAENGARP